jgi:hypothetical protein
MSDELNEFRRKWVETHLERSWWGYGAALFWLAFRDPEVMAEWLADEEFGADGWMPRFPCSAPELAEYVGYAIAGFAGRADEASWERREKSIDAQVFDRDPISSLNEQLWCGAIRTMGRLGGGQVAEISEPNWRGLALPDHSGSDGGSSTANAIRLDHSPANQRQNSWFDLQFNRADLLAAFPSIGASRIGGLPPPLVSVSAQRTAAKRTNAVREARDLNAWLMGWKEVGARPSREQVEDEARDRGWRVAWARVAYRQLADDIGLPKRLPGQRAAKIGPES